jgi:hypothetical protein
MLSFSSSARLFHTYVPHLFQHTIIYTFLLLDFLTCLFIPNFKNFLSLHIFVQSLAEQQHALKISEHTLIIMCNNKTGYNWYSKMPKPTYTAQHPGKFGGSGPTLTWGPLWFHLLTLSLGGPGASLQKNFEIWGPRNGQILHSGSLVSMYISL